MKKHIFYFMLATASLTACIDQSKDTPIGRNHLTINDGILNPTILNSFGRVSDPHVSPDGSKVVYGVSFPNIEKNKSNRELFTVNIDGTDNKQITHSSKSEFHARWIKGGSKIAYLSGEQLWEMNPDGTGAVKLSDYENGINEFTFSPNGKKILFVSEVKSGQRVTDIYPDLPKATGRITDDLMYKHWDEWVESIPHPFVADFDGKKLSNIVDILEGEPYESPTKPFGDISELAWSPDSKTVAYTCRKKTGRDYALSTNTDVYLYDLTSKSTVNLTEGMMGYDKCPQFSPDGKWIAWTSMEREGYEADLNRLFIMDLSTREKTFLTSKFDYNIDAFTWMADSKGIYYASCVNALTHIYTIDLDTKNIRQVTNGIFDIDAPLLAGNQLVSTRRSMMEPNEIVAVNPVTGEIRQLTFENKHILDQLKDSKVEQRWMKTTDNKQMHTWIVYPPDFDPNKKYPAIMMCLGGPQGTINQSWSYRWNYRLMSAQGYIVILPNRRGTTAFGQAWTEQISGDYTGQNMKDYLTAVDEMKKEPYVDGKRIACSGASYGGYSVFWLAGHHEKRFSAFIAHAGIFNSEHMYMTTEEVWFPNWDNGGAPWDKKNKVAQRTYNGSPHLFVDKWDTPILVTHGEKDYRVPYDQGLAAFNAARLHNVPAELLMFPDENHWVLKPQNSILWHRIFYRWLDKWM
jgi:dipeptidyl aminopeptidase/acylaminoacyl peptidase